MSKQHSRTPEAGKNSRFFSGMGYKGVSRRGSSYCWQYNDGRTTQSKGGFETAEEAAYNYDEFLLHYVGPDADTNQALGLLKSKQIIAIREKLSKREKPKMHRGRNSHAIGKSGYKGVSAAGKNFRAQISHKGKNIQIAFCKDPRDAAFAYDMFVIQHIGNDAVTNISLGLLPRGYKPDTLPPDVNVDSIMCTPEVVTTVEKPTLQHCIAKEGTTQPYLDPEKERQAQIEAARSMVDEDEEETEDSDKTDNGVSSEDTKATTLSVDSSLSSSLALGMTDDTPPEQPASAPAADHQTSICSQGPVSVVPAAGDLVRQAAELLKQAATQEADEQKRLCAVKLESLSRSVKGFQAAAMKLIDFGADIEKQIADIKELLHI